MQAKLLKKMQKLSARGYHFVRVTDQYQCEQLLPDQMDASLDSVANTPAYQPMPPMRSTRRQFLLVQDSTGDVIATVYLHSRRAMDLLNRLLDQQLNQLN